MIEFNRRFTFYYPGFNVRSTDLNARLGLTQLRRADTVVARRQRIVSVAIPAAGQQAAFSFVEEGIAVPEGSGDLSIEAGIGNVPGGPEQQAKKKRR